MIVIYFGKFDHKITKKDNFFYFDLVKFFIKSIGESMYCIDKMGDLMFQEMNKDIDPLLCELGIKANEYKITKKQLDLFFETCHLYHILNNTTALSLDKLLLDIHKYGGWK